MNKYFSFTFSGNNNDQYHDGTMHISYVNAFSKSDADSYIKANMPGAKFAITDSEKNGLGELTDYSSFYPDFSKIEGNNFKLLPITINYKTDSAFSAKKSQGLCGLLGLGDTKYSLYRREYEVYERPCNKIRGYISGDKKTFYYQNVKTQNREVITPQVNRVYENVPDGFWYEYDFAAKIYVLTEHARVFHGDWEPVIIGESFQQIYDFNISADKSYQYILYPINAADTDDSTIGVAAQTFANYDGVVWEQSKEAEGQGKFTNGELRYSHLRGGAIPVSWDYWSISELEPLDFDSDVPIIKNAYSVNTDQIWFFKYSLEVGSQTQNISRNEFSTLGQFPKFGLGASNYLSGEVTALLGSEIIYYTGIDYVERLAKARSNPLSTNEKVLMLERWRKLVASKNPKLLKDSKGQSWIVHIVSSTNSPKVGYYRQPETINFSWKQVESTEGVLIYNKDVDLTTYTENRGTLEWVPAFRNKTYNN
jgi:hypothetical protein